MQNFFSQDVCSPTEIHAFRPCIPEKQCFFIFNFILLTILRTFFIPLQHCKKQCYPSFMESSMYNRLLLSPIFTGLTPGELTQILAHIHLEFQQHESGETIAGQGERCSRLTYVLGGRVRAEYADPGRKFVLRETIDKPFVVEPYSFYGLQQSYERSYITEEHAYTFALSKQEFHTMMLNHTITRTNIMNTLCAKIQKQGKLLKEAEGANAESKMVQFLQRNSIMQTGAKELQMKMEDMAAHIKETRLNVSAALKRWNELGLIEQPRRGIIRIPDTSLLLQTVAKGRTRENETK